MANALLAFPLDYTINSSPTGDYPASNVLNDEPGLIWRSSGAVGPSSIARFELDLPVGAVADLLCILGLLDNSTDVRVYSYPTSADRTLNTNGSVRFNAESAKLSTNRSAQHVKCVKKWAPHPDRFLTVDIIQMESTPVYLEAWRILLCTTVQPASNIEVGAGVLIDDRSERTYTRTGRRVIDPTVICPAFQGQWPWLTTAEMNSIRKAMYQRGGTLPWLFVLDIANTTWGEDTVFYGDVEKSITMILDNDDLNTFKFSIVSIAP